MEKNIAEAVRFPTQIELPGVELVEQSRRLRASLRVAKKWIEVASAESGEPGEMYHQARYTYDKLEEELSRVAFEIATHQRRSTFKDLGEDSLEVARASVLSDTVLEAYCIISHAPAETIGDDTSEAETTRYRVMGALLAAMEAAGDEEHSAYEKADKE